MKRLLIVITLSMIVFLSSCSNQKYKTLESKNNQLQHQIDSLIKVCRVQRVLADSSAMEAKRQQHIAIVQSDSATHARNRAILRAMEAAKQRERAINAENALKQIKSVQK